MQEAVGTDPIRLHLDAAGMHSEQTSSPLEALPAQQLLTEASTKGTDASFDHLSFRSHSKSSSPGYQEDAYDREFMTLAGYAGDVEQQDLIPQTPALPGSAAQERSEHDAGEISGPAIRSLSQSLDHHIMWEGEAWL